MYHGYPHEGVLDTTYARALVKQLHPNPKDASLDDQECGPTSAGPD